MWVEITFTCGRVLAANLFAHSRYCIQDGSHLREAKTCTESRPRETCLRRPAALSGPMFAPRGRRLSAFACRRPPLASRSARCVCQLTFLPISLLSPNIHHLLRAATRKHAVTSNIIVMPPMKSEMNWKCPIGSPHASFSLLHDAPPRGGVPLRSQKHIHRMQTTAKWFLSA